MISKYKRSLISVAVSAGLLGTVTWSPASLACSTEPFMSSICIMTWPKTATFGGSLYTIAAGQTLQVSQYQALYSIIGNTYGGTSPSTFALPDLRGRVVVGVGAGPGLPPVNYGNKAGQLPSHAHGLSSNAKITTTSAGMTATTTLGTLQVNTTVGTLAVNTTTGTLAVNTTAGNMGASSAISGLTATLNASTGLSGTAGQDPTGNALPTMSAPARLYTTTPPTIAMNTGSVTMGGDAHRRPRHDRDRHSHEYDLRSHRCNRREHGNTDDAALYGTGLLHCHRWDLPDAGLIHHAHRAAIDTLRRRSRPAFFVTGRCP